MRARPSPRPAESSAGAAARLRRPRRPRSQALLGNARVRSSASREVPALADGKQSFQDVRSQAELGNEEPSLLLSFSLFRAFVLSCFRDSLSSWLGAALCFPPERVP